MGTLPFAASFDALASIVKTIRTVTSEPSFSEFVPALFFCSSSSEVSYEHFMIVGLHPQDVADAVELDICGRRVFAHVWTLEKLIGKQLVLGRYSRRTGRAVESDGPSGSQLLIAVKRREVWV
jgi:hypothetical protein